MLATAEPEQPTLPPRSLPAAACAALICTTLAALIAVVLWASQRGFDIADESIYLNGYVHPTRGPVLTQYDALVGWFARPFGIGIVGFRLARLMVLLGSSAFLGWTLHRFASRQLRPSLAAAMPPPLIAVPTVMITGLLGYAWLPQTISYNGLAAAAIYVQAGCLLLVAPTLKGAVRLGRTAVLAFVVVGALGALLVFIKYPSELAAAAAIAVYLALLPRAVRWRAVMWMGFGAAAVVLCLASETFGGPLSLRALADSRADETHTLAALWNTYATNTAEDLPRAVTSGALRILAFVGLLWAAPVLARDRRRDRRKLAVVLSAVGAAFVIVEIGHLAREGDGGYVHGKGYFGFLQHADLIVSLMVAAGLSALLARFTPPDRQFPGAPHAVRNRTFQALCGLALWVPIAGAIGTNNPPLEQMTVYAAGFGCLLVLATAWITEAVTPRRPMPYAACALAVMSVALGAQAAVGLVRHPYGLPKNLRHQSVSVVGSLTLAGHRVDPPTGRMLRELATILRRRTTVKRDDLVLTPWPGLIYALGAESPFNGWPERGRPPECTKFLGERSRIRRTMVILESGLRTEDQLGCLKAVWPAYASAFVEVGRFVVPGPEGLRLPETVVVQVRRELAR